MEAKMNRTEQFDRAYAMVQAVMQEINQVVLGKEEIVNQLIAVILAKGHVLLEDVPGVGKTTMATAFSKAMSLDYKRVQFTPDVMPSDITGFSMYNKSKNEFEFKPGAAMTNVLLADEINRTSAKTQSSLLEIMEEGSITVDGVTHNVPDPFFVIATQNPLGFVGTQQLPESQLDRFMTRISMGYPTKQIEMEIISQRKTSDPLQAVKKVAAAAEIIAAQNEVQNVFIDQSLIAYMINLIAETRTHAMLELGASPRATLSLMKLAQATAFLNSRSFVIPDDVMQVFYPALNHRVVLKNSAKLNGVTIQQVLTDIQKNVLVPIIK